MSEERFSCGRCEPEPGVRGADCGLDGGGHEVEDADGTPWCWCTCHPLTAGRRLPVVVCCYECCDTFTMREAGQTCPLCGAVSGRGQQQE